MNTITKVGIIGKGVVGSAIYDGMSKFGYNTMFYDINMSNSYPLDVVINNSDMLFICVPTPSKDNGDIDLSIIDKAVDDIMSLYTSLKITKDRLIIIKSTIIPGTTESYRKKYHSSNPNIKFIFSPEFLDDNTAYDDFVKPHKIIIGYTEGSEQCRDVLMGIFSRFAKPEYIFEMSAADAEMVKYMTNIFYVTKVVFANTMYEICKKLEVDYDVVKNAFECNPRVGKYHFNVFDKGGRGAGGKCLPKDLSAIISVCRDKNVPYNMLPFIQKLNISLLRHSNKR